MQNSELLLTFAEIAMAFAGFASLVGILGRTSEAIDASRFLGMVRTSLLVTGFSLLPAVAISAGTPSASAWRLSGALFFVIAGLHTFFIWQRLYRT